MVAKKAGYKRVSYYTHIKQHDLDLGILSKYSSALEYDFSEEIPEIKDYVLSEPEPEYPPKPKTFEEAMQAAEVWRNRYFEEVAKNNQLLQIINKLNL